MTRALHSCLIIFTVFFATVPLAFAQTYSVAPLIMDLELEKRDIVSKEVTITNQGAQQIRVYPSVNAVNLDDNGAIESFVEPSMIDDRTTAVTSWIEVPRKRIEIKPGESATVPVTFRVHPEVQSGEYHAIIGFGTGSNKPQAQAKVMAGTAPVVAVRIGVDKVQNEFLRLQRFNVDRFVTDRSEGTINYTLHNPGDDPVTPGGEIIIYNNRGNEVFTMPVNPEGLTVEPGQRIEIVDSAPNDLSMGKYKAFLSVEFGKNLTASIHDTAFFYIMPLKQIIIIFVVVLVLALAIALYLNRRYAGEVEYDDETGDDVPLYIRTEPSESKDHDIDLKKKD